MNIINREERTLRKIVFSEKYNYFASRTPITFFFYLSLNLALLFISLTFIYSFTFHPIFFVLGGRYCSGFGSPYGNQRALPSIFPSSSFIFPSTSYFLPQQHNVRSTLPFTRVDPSLFSFLLLPPLYRQSLPLP